MEGWYIEVCQRKRTGHYHLLQTYGTDNGSNKKILLWIGDHYQRLSLKVEGAGDYDMSDTANNCHSASSSKQKKNKKKDKKSKKKEKKAKKHQVEEKAFGLDGAWAKKPWEWSVEENEYMQSFGQYWYEVKGAHYFFIDEPICAYVRARYK